jgi:hypothetical protein
MRQYLAIASAVLGLVSYAPGTAVANPGGTQSACGFGVVVGQLNCASITISRTSGACTINNRGTTSETLECTASSYTASGNTLGWINPGSYHFTMGGGVWMGFDDTPCSADVDETQKSWSVPATSQTSGPYTITCPARTITYGYCAGGVAGATATMTFTGEFAPRTISVSATVNDVTDGCVPG